jgi:hypothetical protein
VKVSDHRAESAAAGCDDVRADPTLLMEPVTNAEHGDVSAKSRVAATSIAANTGDLNGAVIDTDRVGLLRVGTGVGTRHRNIDRAIYGVGSVVSVPAIPIGRSRRSRSPIPI